MAPETDLNVPPIKMPVATRAWCIRDVTAKARGLGAVRRRAEPAARPSKFIAIETESVTAATATIPGYSSDRWAGEGQALLFGCAVIGRTLDWQVEREVIFYPDDLPENGVADLREYIEARTYRCGARARNEGDAQPDLIWRDEPRVIAALVPLSQFLKLFYRIAHEDKALVTGFDLASNLSRLAADWHEVKKGRNVGAWHLDLWMFHDPKTGKQRPSAGWRPGLIANHKAPSIDFVQFTGRRAERAGGKDSQYRGEFLDPSNLLNALTGRHWSRSEALATFIGEVLTERQGGVIDAGALDHCRAKLRATVSLTGRLIELFDHLHPISRGSGGNLSEARLYSPGGLARGYLGAVGFRPPAVPEDRLGPCAAAFFGGWAEVQLRGRASVVAVDFRRQYQTVFLLQNLQRLLAAESLEFVEDTDAIRSFVETIKMEDLLHPATYPRLNAICWVKPEGEILPGRWAFNEQGGTADPDRFGLAMTHRHSGGLVPLYLADVIASKFLTGRIVQIVRAERILPKGRQRLRRTRLFGDVIFDPRKAELFKLLVEEGERFRRGEAAYAEIPQTIREALLPGIKGIGNNGCFGVPIETRQAALLPGRREEVTLLSDGKTRRAKVAHPEDSGPFACPPLAGLVAAGGRLLLAMVHRSVADRGGIVAACDTDGAYIVATEKGSTIYIETRGAEFHEGGPAQPVHALSWAEVEAIAARFEPLNPFDRLLLPGSPLRIQGVNFDGVRQVQIDGLFIGAKRNSLTRPDGSLADFKESILGIFMPPADGWIEEAWRALGDIWDAERPEPRPWFDLPVVRSLPVASPRFADQVTGFGRIRSYSRYLAATAIGRADGEPSRAVTVIAPYEADPEKWALLPWRFADSGEPVPLDQIDPDGRCWRLRTLGDILSSYVRHPISEMLAPDGSRCGPWTRGLLRRRPVEDGEHFLVLKEAAVYGDDPAHAFSVPSPELVPEIDREEIKGHWENVIRPALALVGAQKVARKMGLAPRTGRSWTAGERRPDSPREVAHAVVAVAREAGLGLSCDEQMTPEEICADLPLRVLAVQGFVAMAVAMLAARLGGIRALARGLRSQGEGDPEPSMRRWLGLAGADLRSVPDLNAIIVRLARFSRAEIRRNGRRIVTEPGPAGDRQTVIAGIWSLCRAERIYVPTPEESLLLPFVITAIFLFALLADAFWESAKP